MAELRFPNINLVVLSGRLVEDAVVRYTPQGTPVCNVRFASDRNYRNAQGQWVKEPLFISLVLYRGVAERDIGKLKRGTPLIVEGSLRSREFETREGQKRTVFEIVVRRLHILEKGQGEEPVYAPEEEELSDEITAEPDEGGGITGGKNDEEGEDLPF
ncbi:MAG TPA: single-stranded DNA-binding protein [Candidatus Hydrothermia bacterium]|nr:single-stranded DNA-binding protein [Candidatus Hydrothermia bacterium]MDD5573252.1 single-stranded DNA-binding protein [Candidatus Hydrothermia bacterium]HOK22416.1 single-stranded DNA-binding protein [Candidatus Hydrothermia bacterium]HOL23123.1 single-stranded DNA-binding protein [Candidatus Hydrothermia bacterium]HOP32691.1 single-stranded DNA-binding protein [Candidatus Hydrothermia bacterium]